MLVLPAAGMAAPQEGEGSPPPPPAPQLTFEPGSYDFGLQQVNSGRETGLRLRNDGEAPAPVNQLEIQGPNVFWINGGATSCYAKNLQPGESCWIQVGFNPYDATIFTGQLRVVSEGGVTFTAELSGEGGRANMSADTDPTNFGSVAVGSAVTKTIDVTNSGNYPGGSFIAVIAGGAVGSFQLLDENCTGIPLSPGATCNLVVRFQPLSSGAKTARLGLFGDSDGGAQIMLTGVGTDPESPLKVNAADGTSVAPAPPKRRAQRKPRRQVGLHRQRRIDLANRRATY